MIGLLLIAALAILPPPDDVARDEVTTIEQNHFYDFDGRPVFTQYVFWDAEHVRAWRMAKDMPEPTYDHSRRRWQLRWTDSGTLRSVTAASYVESFTQIDVEVADREWLAKEQRRPLRREGAR